MSNLDNYSETIFEDGIEFWYARELQVVLEYVDWRNFKNIIEKAEQLINNGLSKGRILNTLKSVEIGSGAVREIIDYKLDKDAVKLVRTLAYNKLKKGTLIRNETMILSMVEKYCKAKNLKFAFQFKIENYKFDCVIGNKVLIEFDEQHHIGKKQNTIDELKDKLAKNKGYIIQRFDVSNDIVDIILSIEKHEHLLYENNRKVDVIEDLNHYILFNSQSDIIRFENEGFGGLYNGLSKKEVALKKGLSKELELLNHMGSTELSANLFRATQTDEKLRRENIKYKEKAYIIHFEVGAKVRKTIEELGGTMPEDLPAPKKSVKQIGKESQKKELYTD